MSSDERRERQRQSNREHYQRNKAAHIARAAKVKARIREMVRGAKDVPCMDCGVKYPTYVMDLDHRPGEVKLYEATRLILTGSVIKTAAELAKCDPVCSNCHRERTQQRLVQSQQSVEVARPLT